MNGYELSRKWFDFAFENPDKISCAQTALYSWLVEVNNRAGFSEKFVFNTEDACLAIGLHNRKTVWKALNELADNGLVVFIYKSSHKHKPTVISLAKANISTHGCLDKVLINKSKKRTGKETVSGLVGDKFGNGKETVSGHSYKQQTLNNKPQTPPAPAKLLYLDCVMLFEEEYDKLINTHGQEKTDWIINKLNSYKQSQGKKYKSDFGAINNWVVAAMKKEFVPAPQKKMIQ